MLRLPSLVAGLVAGVFAAPWLQDPVKPAPAAEPPAATATPVPAVPGRALPHPLEGVYRLRARVLDSKKDAQASRGYLAITSQHLFLCLAAPGVDAEQPLLRAGVRSWKPKDEFVAATVLLGWYTDKDGTLHLERAGTEERRRIELVQGGVRVVQDERNWLEFERIE